MALSIKHEQNTGGLILVCGLPGTGKSTLIHGALGEYADDLEYMKSFTTRPIRPGEGDEEYIFVNDEEFDAIPARSTPVWEESVNYDYRYGQDTGYFNKRIAMGKYVIGCCYPSISEVESLYPYYDPSAISVVYLSIPQNLRLRRLNEARGKDGIERALRDIDYSATTEFLTRVDVEFQPVGSLRADSVAFSGLIANIMRNRHVR